MKAKKAGSNVKNRKSKLTFGEKIKYRIEHPRFIATTEYSDLSQELENHYSKYFTNRSFVVAEHAKFTEALNTKKTEFSNRGKQIDDRKTSLTTLGSRMDYLLAVGSVYSYNTLVPAYNAQLKEVNDMIEQYNKDIQVYAGVVRELDSTEIPAVSSVVKTQ